MESIQQRAIKVALHHFLGLYSASINIAHSVRVAAAGGALFGVEFHLEHNFSQQPRGVDFMACRKLGTKCAKALSCALRVGGILLAA